MQIFKTKKEINDFVKQLQNNRQTLGFVPTMGALHSGHLSLVEIGLKQSDVVVVSIFVNPTQFNNPNDLKNYPRDLQKDAEMLEKIGCHAIFAPSEKEIYPEEDTRKFELNGVDKNMEGEFRPGHFNGVAKVISLMLDIIPADKAFFGLKDFQQVAVVKQLVKNLHLKTEIVACPTVRETDGLAKSSRNLLLTPEHRKHAGIIYEALSEINKNKHQSIQKIKEIVSQKINQNGLFKVEYLEIANTETLLPISDEEKQQQCVACIAVWAGDVRLIDNVIIDF